jgi:hypothetical protein
MPASDSSASCLVKEGRKEAVLQRPSPSPCIAPVLLLIDLAVDGL